MLMNKCKTVLIVWLLLTATLVLLTLFCIRQQLVLNVTVSNVAVDNDVAQVFMDYGEGFTAKNAATAAIKGSNAQLTIPMWHLFRAKGARLDPVDSSKTCSLERIMYKSVFGHYSGEGATLLASIEPLSGLNVQSVSATSIQCTDLNDPQFRLTKLFDSMHKASVRYVVACATLFGLMLLSIAALLYTCVRYGVRNLSDMERVFELQAGVDKTIDVTKAFLGENWKLFLVVFLTGVFVYGYDITNMTFSIDEEFHWQGVNSDKAWFEQGRWGIVLFRNLLLPFVEYPFISSLTSIFFVAAGYVIFISRHKASFVAKCIFGAVAISSPAYAYIQSFSFMSAYVGASVFLCAVSYRIFSSACRDRNWKRLLVALPLLVLAIAIYQSLIFVFFAFLLIDELTASYDGQTSFSTLFRHCAIGVLFTLAAVILYFVINAGVSKFYPQTGYVNSFMGWHEFSMQKLHAMLDYLFAFYSGKIRSNQEMPYMIVAGILIVCSARQKWLTALITFLTLVYIQIIVILFFNIVPVRMSIQIPVCIGGIFYILAINRFLCIRIFTFFAVLYIVFFNASIVTRLFMTDTFQRYADEQIAGRVINAMYDVCPDFPAKNVPVAFIGFIPESTSALRLTSETFGGSFWRWDQDIPIRKGYFLFSLGLKEFAFASPAQQAIARDIAKTMPCWPEKGFVQYRDGILIIHLSKSDT